MLEITIGQEREIKKLFDNYCEVTDLNSANAIENILNILEVVVIGVNA